MLTAVQRLRLARWEGFPPPLPGRRSIIMLDRWLTPSANLRQAFGFIGVVIAGWAAAIESNLRQAFGFVRGAWPVWRAEQCC